MSNNPYTSPTPDENQEIADFNKGWIVGYQTGLNDNSRTYKLMLMSTVIAASAIFIQELFGLHFVGYVLLLAAIACAIAGLLFQLRYLFSFK